MRTAFPALDRVNTPSRWRRIALDAGLGALFLVVALATSGIAFAGNGNLAVTAAPIVALAVVYAMWTLPVRWSATALLFANLALDGTTNGEGVWHTPWAILGDLLGSNLDAVIPAASGLKLNGTEVVVLVLLAVTVYRKVTGATIDTRGQIPTAGIVSDFVLIAVVAVAFGVANGLARGGSSQVAIWQARPILDAAALFFLFQSAFRGPADYALVARAIILAACAKAAIAVWVRYRVAPHLGHEMQFTTSHGDSILFVVAAIILLTNFMERTDRRRLADCALFLPLILWGIVANTRRLAWVELAFALLAIYFISSWRPWKRVLSRAAVVGMPVLALYVAAGWSSPTGPFAPVQMLRSVSDNRVDRSTWWRDVENWNLAMSMLDNPILGRGFGREYSEYFLNDDISNVFPMYRSEPHNMVLGLMVFGGLLGFAGIWTMLAVAMFLAARAYRFSKRPIERAAALAFVGTAIVLCVQIYGDMGLFATQFKVLGAVVLALAGKLSVAVGAWPRRAPFSSIPRPATAGGE